MINENKQNILPILKLFLKSRIKKTSNTTKDKKRLMKFEQAKC